MIEVQNYDFQQELTDKKYIVVFSAQWCGPCRTIAPVLEEVSEQTKLPIYKVDVDKQEILASKYAVRSIPLILFFNGENIVDQMIGGVSRDKLMEAAAKLAE